MKVAREWNGRNLQVRMRRATAAGLIGYATLVVREAKVNAHVISGTMRRSVHVAPVGYEGGGDLEQAQTQDIANTHHPTPEPLGWGVEVGSWLPYACVEEVGRGHQFVTPAVESTRVQAHVFFRAAARREGL